MNAQQRILEQQALQRIHELITTLESASDPAAAAPARELLQVVLDLHREGLDRLLAIVAGTQGGERLIEHFTTDDQVNALLLLHDLHPQDLETRVRAAIEHLRPHLAVQGIGVAAVEIEAGGVRLQLRAAKGGGGDKSPSAEALRRELEEAIFRAAPDVASIDMEGLPVPAVYVSVSSLSKRTGKAAAGG